MCLALIQKHILIGLVQTCHLLCQHLVLVEFVIDSLHLEQFRVLALLSDHSLVKHSYAVGVMNGREAVSNDYACTTFRSFVQSFLHGFLAFGVQRRSGLVQ